MRRISREERIGALVLATVTMVAIIGGAWWRHKSDTDVPSPAEVTIISEPDYLSTVAQKYHGNDKGKRSGKVKDSDYKRNHSNKKHIGDRSSASGRQCGDAAKTSNYRDFLSDTVPTSR